ncbi:unnamed protein product [Alopecurus aequalis]
MALVGAGDAPTEAYLNNLARILSVKPEASGWVCCRCGHRNDPVDNLLFKLPPLNCSNTTVCDGKCPVTPEWSISDCIINEVRTNFLIRDQGPYPTCAAHALLSGMDASLRIHGAIHGRIVSQPLNIVNLFEKYRLKHRVSLGCEGDDDEGKKSRTPRLLQIAQLEGVEYIAPTKSVETRRVLRLKSWFYKNTNGDINFLVRLIASGFPLLASMRTGRCFVMANNGELYMAPELTVNHAILLIGCTVKPLWLPPAGADRTNEPVEKVFFKARDSKGDRVHVSGGNVGTGGDIYLLPEDLGSHVFGFHLELPTWMR